MKKIVSVFFAMFLICASVLPNAVFAEGNLTNKTINPGPTPQVIVLPEGGMFNWQYQYTTTGSDKLVNGFADITMNGILGLCGLYAGARIAGSQVVQTTLQAEEYALLGKFGGWVTGYATGRTIPKGSTMYWTTKKYTDYDAIYNYQKFEYKLYSNSSRTNLIGTGYEIRKF